MEDIINSSVLEKGSFSPLKNKLALIFADVLSFFAAFLIVGIYLLADGNAINLDVKGNSYRFLVFVGVATFTILVLWAKYRHYTYRKPFWDELNELYSLLAVAALIDMLLLSLGVWDYSPSQWGCIWLSVFVFIPLFRTITKIVLNILGCWRVPSIIIGAEDNAKEAYLAVNSESMMGFNVIAFIEPEESDFKGALINNVPLLRKNQYKSAEFQGCKIFIALEHHQRDLCDQWIRTLSSRGISNISVVPAVRGVPLYSTEVSHFFSHELIMLRLNNNLIRKSSRFLKRSFDIIVSSLLLAILSPLFAYVGWKVSRDGGSATYGHERVGFAGKKFKCLKFRSMVMNSQEVLTELLESDEQAKAEWDKDFKLKNDPRITPIGHFLRKTSLDELPQLWNVLKGEMSLVGPRPIIDEELLRYKEDADYYLMAKPGMSGLWQVSGRNDVDYDTRVYLDSWYVKNWSLWNDIAILFKTVGVVLERDGAY